MKKLLIPCVYLKYDRLVKGFGDNTVLSDDPAGYCSFLSVNGADAILLFDLSDSDEEHELSLLTVRKITKAINTPVYGAGNVKRLEDVKKLLYAGCRKVALNMAKQSNIDLIEEAGKRFSKSKILVCADSLEQILDNLKVIRENTDGALLLGKLFVEKFDEIGVIPVINKECSAAEILSKNCVLGISGDIVNEHASDMYSFRDELSAAGIETSAETAAVPWEELKTDCAGLVPVVCQDHATGAVLMVAYMNKEAYEKTVREGIMTYYSRSRKCLWKKGETSGHYQYVKSLYCDCDKDTILAKVIQIGNACHTGEYSCFFNEILKTDDVSTDPYTVLEDVMSIILDRKENPKEGSYTNYLFDKGLDKILKKVGEEAAETVIAAKNPEPEEIKYEIADLLYHLMVLMALKGITWADVMEELARR
ncbi:MAG: bifunctional phosphoribosyl-AMP cyclohydrolase/phosphoribosyl-ATP diphosphatase HisIE [Lachnospiraceae bacterium]|nr:bifunctional phosphoribosyl-AMP cyclohydrolase/phosphoribosyl-ATP diphosphatase HisIE [Lachnospiraceae bacterium]